MTDRNILVRDMIVHRYMERKGIPTDQQQIVIRDYNRFRGENRAWFEDLEALAVNTG